jgi:hypothetical protein
MFRGPVGGHADTRGVPYPRGCVSHIPMGRADVASQCRYIRSDIAPLQQVLTARRRITAARPRHHGTAPLPRLEPSWYSLQPASVSSSSRWPARPQRGVAATHPQKPLPHVASERSPPPRRAAKKRRPRRRAADHRPGPRAPLLYSPVRQARRRPPGPSPRYRHSGQPGCSG